MADAIQLWDTGDGWKWLLDGDAVSIDPSCCCVSPCCGREYPRDPPQAGDLPTTFNVRITSDDCYCWTTYEGTITWNAFTARWELFSITWPGCEYGPGYILLYCGGEYESTDVVWFMEIGGFNDCQQDRFEGDPPNQGVAYILLRCASCDPVDCSGEFYMAGPYCCDPRPQSGPTPMPTEGNFLVELWE